ncbi:MAG: short-chain-enoyl-CoA hydratase [Alphaproteobacteria bacterium]|nr:MAG: short-chain-enoyl-CoA hydratase [Alphaproteobacteria bacterium]
MSANITVEKTDAVAVLRFHNPDRGLMDSHTETALGPALDDVEDDESIRAVVLTGGQPGIFIRHFDLSVLERRGRDLAARGLTFSPSRPVPEAPLHKAFRRIERSAKPYVCAINGTAMGGGLELALCCDIRMVESGDYSLGQPEINAGLLPGAGGTQRLARIVGIGRAMEIALLGRSLSPAETVRIGLASECVDGPVLPRAMEIARLLAGKPPRALAHIKRLVHEAFDAPLDDRLAVERTLFCDLLVSADALDAMARIQATHGDIRREPADEARR